MSATIKYEKQSYTSNEISKYNKDVDELIEKLIKSYIEYSGDNVERKMYIHTRKLLASFDPSQNIEEVSTEQVKVIEVLPLAVIKRYKEKILEQIIMHSMKEETLEMQEAKEPREVIKIKNYVPSGDIFYRKFDAAPYKILKQFPPCNIKLQNSCCLFDTRIFKTITEIFKEEQRVQMSKKGKYAKSYLLTNKLKIQRTIYPENDMLYQNPIATMYANITHELRYDQYAQSFI
jgi:hypothetical protein